MSARISINLGSSQLEAEGAPEFVERIYADFRDLIVERSNSLSQKVRAPVEDQGERDLESNKPKPQRRRVKGGPSCASRIQALKDESYFEQLRSANEVGSKLREKGTAYEGKHIAAALIDLVKRGNLRRVSEAGAWSYQNP